jgi:glycosyltransferase involved in cell wall biosynthesis
MSRDNSPPPRILHVPGEFGVNSYGLSRGERELGFESDVAVFKPSPYGYGFDFDLHAGVDQPIWRRMYRRAAFLRRALGRYDVFHFNFGLTLLSVRQLGLVLDELAWIKRRGKTVLFTYQGSDVRASTSCPCGKEECRRLDGYRQRGARRALRFADRVFYLNPDLRRWLPGARFLPYANVDPRALQPVPLPEGDEVVVVHAPTDRKIKGTKYVIDAVEQLRKEGVAVRLDLVEGGNRDDVFARVARADLVIDQLLIGWYGGFAVEAMALGRPVLAYICEEEPEDNPFGEALPIVRTSAATLTDKVRELAVDRERRRELGAAGRTFVEQHHDPVALAREALGGLVAFPGTPATM